MIIDSKGQATLERCDPDRENVVKEFQWEIQGARWVLSPSTISVAEINGYWIIHVADCPLDARYTSLQGAKLDAWQFAVSKRKALFGEYSISLRE